MATIVIEDTVAERLGEALKVANRFAWAAGWNPEDSRITITPRTSEEGVPLLRVSYGAIDPVGRRGGDFIVEVYAQDASFYRILYGQ